MSNISKRDYVLDVLYQELKDAGRRERENIANGYTEDAQVEHELVEALEHYIDLIEALDE